jgi:hypothetical protein
VLPAVPEIVNNEIEIEDDEDEMIRWFEQFDDELVLRMDNWNHLN